MSAPDEYGSQPGPEDMARHSSKTIGGVVTSSDISAQDLLALAAGASLQLVDVRNIITVKHHASIPTECTAVVFATNSTKGSTVVVGCSDGFLKWYPVAENEEKLVERDSQQFQYIDVSDDNHLGNGVGPQAVSSIVCSKVSGLLAAASGRSVCIFSSGGEHLHTLGPFSSEVSGLAWLAENVVAAAVGSIVRCWTVDDEACTSGCTYTTDSPAAIRSIAVAPNLDQLAAACSDGMVAVWRVPQKETSERGKPGETQQVVLPLHKFQDAVATEDNGVVRSICWDPEGRYIATAYSSEALIWDVREQSDGQKPSCVCTGHAANEVVTCLALQPGGKLLATGTDKGNVLAFDGSLFNNGIDITGPCSASTASLAGHDPVAVLCWTASGMLLACSSAGAMTLLKPPTPQPPAALPPPPRRASPAPARALTPPAAPAQAAPMAAVAVAATAAVPPVATPSPLPTPSPAQVAVKSPPTTAPERLRPSASGHLSAEAVVAAAAIAAVAAATAPPASTPRPSAPSNKAATTTRPSKSDAPPKYEQAGKYDSAPPKYEQAGKYDSAPPKYEQAGKYDSAGHPTQPNGSSGHGLERTASSNSTGGPNTGGRGGRGGREGRDQRENRSDARGPPRPGGRGNLPPGERPGQPLRSFWLEHISEQAQQQTSTPTQHSGMPPAGPPPGHTDPSQMVGWPMLTPVQMHPSQMRWSMQGPVPMLYSQPVPGAPGLAAMPGPPGGMTYMGSGMPGVPMAGSPQGPAGAYTDMTGAYKPPGGAAMHPSGGRPPMHPHPAQAAMMHPGHPAAMYPPYVYPPYVGYQPMPYPYQFGYYPAYQQPPAVDPRYGPRISSGSSGGAPEKDTFGPGPSHGPHQGSATPSDVRSEAGDSSMGEDRGPGIGTLYVGNLGPGVSESDLKAEFQAFGTIINAQVIRERVTGVSRNFGFVTYQDPKVAAVAMRAMNNQRLTGVFESRHLKVSPSNRDPNHPHFRR